MRLSRMAMAGLCVGLCLLLAPTALSAATVDSNTFGGLEARAIGPAVMSGRIAALDVVPQDPLTIYVGAATGGVWKSENAGTTFEPIFDDHPQSIGAIEIDPSQPETVWVGTGEPWTRNSVSIGKGVYKTTDGGETWTLMGLEETERISRIVVHPSDSDTVYVCATGHLWNANEERGIFKTTDGGESWEKIFYVDEDTGCSDLALDEQDPTHLYAGMWQFRRSAYFFTSGGPGSGLFKSTDGGETWRELTEGLPEGEKGRVAVAVAPSRSSVLYALVEAEKTALYRSDNTGETWREVNSSFNIQARPFYFAQVYVDPQDHDIVYKPGFMFSMSRDGGKSFTSLAGSGFSFSIHPDHHAFWVNPDDPNEMYLGTDGGVYHSSDKSTTWRFLRTLPLSQFYQVSYDMETPYNVYGGLQDNGSWMGPSQAVGGIQGKEWDNIGGGDGFFAFRDPAADDFVYVEFQGGNIQRVRLSTKEAQDIKPRPAEGEEDYRFNWNAPIHLSPNEVGTIYIGSQFLHRSRDHGLSWERISPDLTTDDPAKQNQAESGGLTPDNTTAENHTTIVSICESPRDAELIWVGTDDGNLQITRDGGESWTNVVGNVEGLPPHTYVSSIEAGHFDDGTAYVTFDGHRSGDKATYVYKTTDFGATWSSLASEQIEGYTHVIKEDLVEPNLLFLGTEFGLYISLDEGANWARFKGGVPRVPVHDLAVHPREHDLIIGTHGRGIYILDDISPLRILDPGQLEENVVLLMPERVEMSTPGQAQFFSGNDEFVGPNPSDAGRLAYYLKKRHIFGDLKIEIVDPDGEVISTLPGGKRKGINRVDWPMRLAPPKLPPASNLAFAFTGPAIPEGTYTVRLTKGKKTYESQVEVAADPRSPHSPEDRAMQQEASLELYRSLERLTYLVEAITELRDQSKEQVATLKERDKVRKSAEAYSERLEELRKSVVSSNDGGLFSDDARLREKMAELFNGIVNFGGRPTQTQLDRKAVLVRQLDDLADQVESITGDDLAALNRALAKRQIEPLKWKTREEWDAEQES